MDNVEVYSGEVKGEPCWVVIVGQLASFHRIHAATGASDPMTHTELLIHLMCKRITELEETNAKM